MYLVSVNLLIYTLNQGLGLVYWAWEPFWRPNQYLPGYNTRVGFFSWLTPGSSAPRTNANTSSLLIVIDERHVGLIDSMDVRRSYVPRICHPFATMQVGSTHGADVVLHHFQHSSWPGGIFSYLET